MTPEPDHLLDALCAVCGFRYGLHRGTPADQRCPDKGYNGWANTFFKRPTVEEEQTP